MRRIGSLTTLDAEFGMQVSTSGPVTDESQIDFAIGLDDCALPGRCRNAQRFGKPWERSRMRGAGCPPLSRARRRQQRLATHVPHAYSAGPSYSQVGTFE